MHFDKYLEKNTEITKKKFEKDRMRIIANEHVDRLRIPEGSAEDIINKVVISGKEGKDYVFIDLGKQHVETSKIDWPKGINGSKDFYKYSQSEMEKYIQQGGLEKTDQHRPIKLLKVGDRYCVDSDGHHRVFLAKNMARETIPAHVKKLKILKQK